MHKTIFKLARIYLIVLFFMYAFQQYLLIFPQKTSEEEIARTQVLFDMEYDAKTHFWFDKKTCSDSASAPIVLFFQGNAGNQAMQVDYRQPRLAESNPLYGVTTLAQQLWKGSCVYQYEYPSFGARGDESRFIWRNVKQLEAGLLEDSKALLSRINPDNKRFVTFSAESLGTGFSTSAVLSKIPTQFNKAELFVPVNKLPVIAANRYKVFPTVVLDFLMVAQPTLSTKEAVCSALDANKEMYFDLFIAEKDEVVGATQGGEIADWLTTCRSENKISKQDVFAKTPEANMYPSNAGPGQVHVFEMKGSGHNNYLRLNFNPTTLPRTQFEPLRK